ncbi:MAG TPA: flagellar hook-associated protein FlgL [Terriglobales bacterium]|nr:flagellar hook-associated protein FlgL [Terriglobales bacterium]
MSAIRVNPYPTPDLLAALAESQQQQQTDLLQLATGRKINQPSDDPAGTAQLIQNLDQQSQADSYQRSMSSVNGELSTADSTLNSVVTVLQRAISLGTEGANGTLSDADRLSVASEVQGIQAQLLSLANTSYQGHYIFSGTAQTQPFVADSTQPSGVRYDGNTDVNSVSIGNGYSLQVNLPGSQIFSTPSPSVFQSIQDLINALQSNTNIGTAVNEVSVAYSHVNAVRVFYGNGMNQITDQQTNLNSVSVNLSSQENTIAGADLATVISNLVNSQTSRQATLQAIGQTSQLNLFNYLPPQ